MTGARNWKSRRRRRNGKFKLSLKQKLTDFFDLKNKNMVAWAKLAFIGVLALSILMFVVVPIFALQLPSPDKVVRRDGFSTTIYDRKGEVLYDIYNEQRRSPVEIEDVPDYLKQATIAIEDKNFYKHSGFDPLGMIRGFSRIFTRGRAQGGSTLTQQLVKNVLLSSERTITRKIKEFILATQIEARYSKDEILQMYLNEAPYGGTAWGVEAAAEMYFGKEVSELDLIESAFLAGLPQRPSVYSPYSSYPEAYIERTKAVLRRMREDGYITDEQEKAAVEQLPDMQFLKSGESFKAPHFVQYVQQILEERYGEAVVQGGGLQVTTSLDWDLQQEAQKIVAEEIEKVESLDIGNGAAVVLDSQTGEVLAMVGSKDFNDPNYDGQVNVTLALRQPGSSIKPVVYVTAFQKGLTPATMLMDVPTAFPAGVGQPDYEPVNYDGQYRGPMQLRYALANSINVIAVKVLALAGLEDTLQTAYDMGINSLKPTDELLGRVGLSMALGGGEVRLLELTGAYGAFMNGGRKIEPVAILKVEDRNGKVLEENKLTEGKQVLDPRHAFLIADILSDNEARSEVFGLNSLLNIPGRDVAVKTGTTNDKRDNWAIGGTPQVVVGAWVGNNDNSPMGAVASGVSGASPIWRRILLEALKGKPNQSFEVPEGIVQIEVDTVSGYRAHDGFPSRAEYFVSGTEPSEDDPIHVKLKLCKGQDKLATPADIAANNFVEKEYFIFKEEDPFGGEVNLWQKGIDEWIAQQNNPKYNPPTEYCDSSNSAPLNVDFDSPRDRDSNLDNEITVKFHIDSIHGVKLAELYIDGTKVRSFTGTPYEYKAELEDGVHEIRAVAYDNEDNESDRRITVGVNTEWNAPEMTPTPSPSPTSGPTPTPDS